MYIYIRLDHTHDNIFEISILTHQLYQHFFSESRSSASSAPRPRCPLPPQWKPALDIYGRGRQRRICCGAFGDFLSEHPDDSGLCDLNLWLFSWGKSWLACFLREENDDEPVKWAFFVLGGKISGSVRLTCLTGNHCPLSSMVAIDF